MAETKKGGGLDPQGVAKAIEDSIKKEMEAPKKWAHHWGPVFPNELPHNGKIDERIEYLKQTVKEIHSGAGSYTHPTLPTNY